ncbi:fam-e protein [Plasmodium gallinaceum]|uniref:Fam-e protein n=1 Tax=Plasmodium gallinaceum TaxID=5849 RepID=A0A1J1GY22_PLAGA|nr:fam-e protein [Plasmodium gallinaceum]CRG97160.1 fam-e protein [Plasmodium gallinaceum]
MALLYNEGCENPEKDITKCNVTACVLHGSKFKSVECDPAFKTVVKYSQKNSGDDIKKNIFVFEDTPPPYKNDAKITFLSQDSNNDIVFLYEVNPKSGYASSLVYLCRFRNLKPGLSLCQEVEKTHIGRPLSFNTIDILDRDNENNFQIGLKYLKNKRHATHKAKYEDIFFSKDSCHYVTEGNSSEQVCRYSICKKNSNGNIFCKDAKFNGKLCQLEPYNGLTAPTKFVYLPNSCIKESPNYCTPYLCQYEKPNELYPCSKLEISTIKDVVPHSQSLALASKQDRYISNEDNTSSSLIAMSFFPFLILFFFVGCYLYKVLRRNRKKKRYASYKEP